MAEPVAITSSNPVHVIDYPENPHFVARDTLLERIAKKLTPRPSEQQGVRATPAFSIWGGGGQGKTQTAAHFAYLHCHIYHAILWITADTVQKLLEGLAEYALRLGLVATSGDINRDAAKLLAWFKDTATPWLLIYDNAEDALLINKYWPGQSQNGAILITSRDSVFATTNVAGDGEELPPLDEASAVEMLRKGIPNETFDFKEARNTVDILGRVALGIQATIGLINDSQVSLRQFNKDFHTPQAFLDGVEIKHVYRSFAPYEKTLAGVWKEELQVLATNSDAALRLLEVIALMDPDSIQERLLVDALKLVMQRQKTPAPSLTKCLMALKRLVSSKKARDGRDGDTYYVHRFLQAFTQKNMTMDNRHSEVLEVATMVLKELMSPHWEVDWAKWKYQFSQYIRHVEAVRQFFLDLERHEEHRLRQIPVSFLEMIRKAGLLCYKRNFLRNGYDMLDTAQEIVENRPDIVVGDEEAIMFEKVEIPFMQACIATEVGDFVKSLKNFQKAHEAFKAMRAAGYAKEFEHTLVGGLANSYSGINSNIISQKLYRDCIKLQRPEDEFEHPYEINLCRAMWAHGKDKEAVEYLEEYIARRVKKFGVADDVEDYLAGHALNVLGNVLIGQDRLEEAFMLHKRALVCWNLTYGIHHKTGDLNYKLAWHYANRRDWKHALEHLDEAMAIYAGGSDKNFRRGEIARTKYKKGAVLCRLGKVEEGRELILEAESLRKEILGDPCPPMVGEVSFDCLISLWAR